MKSTKLDTSNALNLLIRDTKLTGDLYSEVESVDDLTNTDKINTEGRDSLLFITSEGVLVFASDGRPGLGGLDLFYVDLNSESKNIYTFGEPLNSRYDDFGLIYKTSAHNGFSPQTALRTT